jgi:hypothetical protein
MQPAFRAEVIDLRQEDSNISATSTECNDLGALHRHLLGFDNEQQTVSRVLLIETVPQPGQAAADHLREQLKCFGIEDDFFKKHYALGPNFTSNEKNIKIFQLPTALAPEDLWHIDYFELYTWHSHCDNSTDVEELYCEGDGEAIPYGKMSNQQVQMHKWKARDMGRLLVAPRKCSYWSRPRGAAWDGKFPTSDRLPSRE